MKNSGSYKISLRTLEGTFSNNKKTISNTNIKSPTTHEEEADKNKTILTHFVMSFPR